jgi:hypothetical protein
MAKLFTMFLVLIAIQVVLLIYVTPTAEDTSLWNFIMNINNWNSLPFVLSFVGIAGGLITAGIVAGWALGFKTDFIIFAPAIAGFITIGVIFNNLANFLRAEIIPMFFPDYVIEGVIIGTPTPVTLIIGLVVGIPALYYVWTIVEWWRNKDY